MGGLLQWILDGSLELSSLQVQEEAKRLQVFLEHLRTTQLQPATLAISQLEIGEAHKRSLSLLEQSLNFANTVRSEISELEIELACCSLHHAIAPTFHMEIVAIALFAVCALYGASTWLAAPGKSKLGSRRQ